MVNLLSAFQTILNVVNVNGGVRSFMDKTNKILQSICYCLICVLICSLIYYIEAVRYGGSYSYAKEISEQEITESEVSAQDKVDELREEIISVRQSEQIVVEKETVTISSQAASVPQDSIVSVTAIPREAEEIMVTATPTPKPTATPVVTATPKPTPTAVPNRYNLSASDKELLAKVIFIEGRGESWECQCAIGSVVLNRLSLPSEYGSSLYSVIMTGSFVTADINNVTPFQQQYDIVNYLCDNGVTIPEYVCYFRANRFHSWSNNAAIDYKKIDNTYFSYCQRDKDLCE